MPTQHSCQLVRPEFNAWMIATLLMCPPATPSRPTPSQAGRSSIAVFSQPLGCTTAKTRSMHTSSLGPHLKHSPPSSAPIHLLSVVFVIMIRPTQFRQHSEHLSSMLHVQSPPQQEHPIAQLQIVFIFHPPPPSVMQHFSIAAEHHPLVVAYLQKAHQFKQH